MRKSHDGHGGACNRFFNRRARGRLSADAGQRARRLRAHFARLPARVARIRSVVGRARRSSRKSHRSSTRRFAPSSEHFMSADYQKPRRRARWPPFAVGSSGWRATSTSSRMRRRSSPRRGCPKHLPRVPSIEQMNRVVDSVGDDAASWPARDRAILEMLYGCGIRNAELTGLNLDDIHWANEAILVRGKGQKQRYVPLGDAAAAALRAYLSERSARLAAASEEKPVRTPALFVNLQLRGIARGRPGAADHAQRGPHREAHRDPARALFRRASAYVAPRLRHASTGRGRRPARHSGAARPRAVIDHAALHAADHCTVDRGLRQDASAGKVRRTEPGYVE